MPASIAPLPTLRWFTAGSQTSAPFPLVGGKVFFYAAGTTTLKNTYSDAAGVVPNSNPIILNARGESDTDIRLGLGAYKVVVQNAAGVQQGPVVDNIKSGDQYGAELLAQLAGTGGAGLIGVLDAGDYFNAATVEAILQEIGSRTGKFQVDGVNVLRYIPPAEWAAIIAGTSTTNLYSYIQTALTAEKNLIFPDGLFNTAQKLIPRVDARIHGINRRGPRLRITTAGTVLEVPYLATDISISNLRFQGPSGYTGIAVAATGGAFQGYLVRGHLKGLDFDYATNGFGINADFIYGHVEECSFGFYSEVVTKPVTIGTGSFTGLKSFVYPATSNFTNLNVLERCIFDGCGNQATASAVALDLNGGTGWTLRDNDFSFGGVQIRTQNIQALKFEGTNWFEGNTATLAVVEFGICTTPIRMIGTNWTNNTCDRLVQGAFSTGATKGLVWTDSEIAKVGSTFCLYDTQSLSYTLPANGSVAFRRNNVSGGAASDKCMTATDFDGGSLAQRIGALVDSTGTGTILECSDPGATLVRNGVGDVTLVSISHPLATAVNKVKPTTTGLAATQFRVLITNVNSIRVQGFNAAGAAADGIMSISATGA